MFVMGRALNNEKTRFETLEVPSRTLVVSSLLVKLFLSGEISGM